MDDEEGGERGWSDPVTKQLLVHSPVQSAKVKLLEHFPSLMRGVKEEKVEEEAKKEVGQCAIEGSIGASAEIEITPIPESGESVGTSVGKWVSLPLPTDPFPRNWRKSEKEEEGESEVKIPIYTFHDFIFRFIGG